jgi:hypothetical protein
MNSLIQNELAQLFGVSQRTIRDWGAAGLPRNADGTYPGPLCVQWRIDRQRPDDELDLEAERARLAHEQANKTAMENAISRGEHLEASRVGADLERAFVVFKQSLRSSPTKLAPMVAPENAIVARDIIANEHDRILEELANHFASIASSGVEPAVGAAGSDSSAPPESDGEPVVGQVSKAKQRNKRGARAIPN